MKNTMHLNTVETQEMRKSYHMNFSGDSYNVDNPICVTTSSGASMDRTLMFIQVFHLDKDKIAGLDKWIPVDDDVRRPILVCPAASLERALEWHKANGQYIRAFLILSVDVSTKIPRAALECWYGVDLARLMFFTNWLCYTTGYTKPQWCAASVVNVSDTQAYVHTLPVTGDQFADLCAGTLTVEDLNIPIPTTEDISRQLPMNPIGHTAFHEQLLAADCANRTTSSSSDADLGEGTSDPEPIGRVQQ